MYIFRSEIGYTLAGPCAHMYRRRVGSFDSFLVRWLYDWIVFMCLRVAALFSKADRLFINLNRYELPPRTNIDHATVKLNVAAFALLADNRSYFVYTF